MYIIPLSDELFCSLESGTQILRYPIGPVAFPPLSAPLLRLTPGACRLPVPYISRAIADALCAGVRACPLGLLAARTVTAPTRSFPPVGSFPLCGSPHQPRGSWGLVVDPAPLSRAGGLPTLHPRPAPFSFRNLHFLPVRGHRPACGSLRLFAPSLATGRLLPIVKSLPPPLGRFGRHPAR